MLIAQSSDLFLIIPFTNLDNVIEITSVTKLPWPLDSKGAFRSGIAGLSQTAIYPPVYHIQWSRVL